MEGKAKTAWAQGREAAVTVAESKGMTSMDETEMEGENVHIRRVKRGETGSNCILTRVYKGEALETVSALRSQWKAKQRRHGHKEGKQR